MPKLFAVAAVEFIGTAVLVCTVIGSGIMGTQLSDDLGVALLINALSTVFVLVLLIVLLAPISGAHLNPVVSLAEVLRKKLSGRRFVAYVAAQLAGAVAGALLANVMFNRVAVEFSQTERVSWGTLIGEVVATAGLIVVIVVLVSRANTACLPAAVAIWIGSAYFFTSSTSFANPAVTIGRLFTDSFAGISPGSVLPFILAQLVGMLLGLGAATALVRAESLRSPSPIA